MILAVAERGNCPGLSQAQVERITNTWRRTPLRCMLTLESMVPGCAARNRLHRLLGRPVDRVANLLPPDRKIGTWDRDWAQECAGRLSTWLNRSELSAPDMTSSQILEGDEPRRGPVTHVVLCGKRVFEAWSPDVPRDRLRTLEIGEWWEWRDVRYMWIPHPSGRNRTWNSVENVEKVLRCSLDFFDSVLPFASEEV